MPEEDSTRTYQLPSRVIFNLLRPNANLCRSWWFALVIMEMSCSVCAIYFAILNLKHTSDIGCDAHQTGGSPKQQI